MAGPAQLRNIQQGRVTVPGQKEGIAWSFYDSLLYPFGGIPRLDFFQTPQGQGITTAVGAPVGSPKTAFDTNMDLQGALPRFQDFQLESIELKFYAGASAAAQTFVDQVAPVLVTGSDVKTFRDSGELVLSITSKDYLKVAPLDRFPSKVHPDAAVSGIVWNDVDITGRPFFLDPFIMLLSNQNFVISLLWPAPVPLPSGFNARVVCIMEGILYRNVQ